MENKGLVGKAIASVARGVKEKESQLGLVVQAFDPSTTEAVLFSIQQTGFLSLSLPLFGGGAAQVDPCEFKVSLVYRASSRPAKVTETLSP